MPASPARASFLSRAALALATVALSVLSIASASAAVLHVDVTRGSDANDGSSWVTARRTIGSALADAATTAEPDTILVARGRYEGALRIPPDTTLLGGHPTGGGARDPKAHPTVLDGRGAAPVVALGPGTDASIVDGFTIRGG